MFDSKLLGISWNKNENRYHVRVAHIFLKKEPNQVVAIELRDTCLLKLMEDPQNKVPAAKKIEINKAYARISKVHCVKSHPQHEAFADFVYERYILKRTAPVVYTASLPIGLSFSQDRWRIKFQSKNVIYNDDRGIINFNDAVFKRDALLKTLRDNNAILDNVSGELARPDLEIPQKYLKYAKNIYDNAQKRHAKNIADKEEKLIMSLVSAEILPRFLSPSPPPESERAETKTKRSKRRRIS
jgi:hypothetical protein